MLNDNGVDKIEPASLYSSIQVQIHWARAILAFTLVVILLAGKKRKKLHVIAGRVWVTIMILVSVTAVFIRTPPADSNLPLLFGFSPIHLLVPFTLVLLFLESGMPVRKILNGTREL